MQRQFWDLVCLLDGGVSADASERLKSPSIRGDNPMIQNLIAAIYRGIACFPSDDGSRVSSLMEYSEFKKFFLSLFSCGKFLIK